MIRLGRWGLVACALGLVACFVAPSAVGRFCAKEVLLITPAAPEAVAANRALWLEGDPVAEIYGTPTGQPTVLVCPDETKIIRPAEQSGLSLYPVDKQKGENPLQLKTVGFFAHRAAVGFGVGLLACIGLVVLGRRRAARA